jgi:phage shock protein C
MAENEMNEQKEKDGVEIRRFYRDRERGCCLGVCAGIADYFGFDLTATRIIAVISLFLFMPMTVLVYFGTALLVPAKPRPADAATRSSEDEKFQKAVRSAPQATLASIRHRFRELEARLQRMERYVTSSRFNLDREFRNLGDTPDGSGRV